MSQTPSKIIRYVANQAKRLWEETPDNEDKSWLEDVKWLEEKVNYSLHGAVVENASETFGKGSSFLQEYRSMRGSAYPYRNAVRNAGFALSESFMLNDVNETAIRLKNLADALLNYKIFAENLEEKFRKKETPVVQDVFTYQGFKVLVRGLTESQTESLLKGIDFLVKVFKKRKVFPVLQESIQLFYLRPWKKSDDNMRASYAPRDRVVTLLDRLIGGQGRITKQGVDFILEAVVHEIGHWVHLKYLAPDAKRYWDSAWDSSKKQLETLEHEAKERFSVPFDLRKRFFDLLISHKGDLRAVSKSLKSPDLKRKLHIWLANPAFNEPLVTPKNLRWSKESRHTRDFLRNPEEYISEPYGEEGLSKTRLDKMIFRRLRSLKNNLFVDDKSRGVVVTDDIDKYRSYLSDLKDSAPDLIEPLNIPTQYGRTNQDEDFAETFAWFLIQPEKLSPQALFRMKRTLSLSGLYGRKFMRLSRMALRESKV